MRIILLILAYPSLAARRATVLEATSPADSTDMTHKPTPEQDAILSAVATSTSNLMLVARAGCAKPPPSSSSTPPFDPQPSSSASTNPLPKTRARKFAEPPQSKPSTPLGHSIWAEYHGRKLILNKNKLGTSTKPSPTMPHVPTDHSFGPSTTPSPLPSTWPEPSATSHLPMP